MNEYPVWKFGVAGENKGIFLQHIASILGDSLWLDDDPQTAFNFIGLRNFVDIDFEYDELLGVILLWTHFDTYQDSFLNHTHEFLTKYHTLQGIVTCPILVIAYVISEDYLADIEAMKLMLKISTQQEIPIVPCVVNDKKSTQQLLLRFLELVSESLEI